MVHFAIAEKLFNHEPSSEFLLGSIAPDAIHMRENANRREKNITHLCSEDGTMPDLITFRDFCYENLRKHEDAGWKRFVLGYVSHLFADLRWTETVWEEYVEKANKNEPIKNQYNREVCQIDFDLFKKEVWADKIFSLLAASHAYAMEPLLSSNEISLYRTQKTVWLKDEMNNPGIIPLYITELRVREFINHTVNELKLLIQEWDRECTINEG
jgi:hypothetical protein